jgi:hypothetical protein
MDTRAFRVCTLGQESSGQYGGIQDLKRESRKHTCYRETIKLLPGGKFFFKVLFGT